MAQFTEDWHGVPAGTEVNILERTTGIAGEPLLVVARADGELLPCFHEPNWRTWVAPEFIAA